MQRRYLSGQALCVKESLLEVQYWVAGLSLTSSMLAISAVLMAFVLLTVFFSKHAYYKYVFLFV